MPADREIHFGFVGPEAIFTAIEAMGLPVADYNGTSTTVDALRAETFDDFEIDPDGATDIHRTLREAYEAIAARLGWTLIAVENDHYTIYDTPFGRRKTSPFSLRLQYDEDEIGDEPEDATLGVNLSSRYFPSVLDVKNAHGTIGSVIDFDALAPEIAICREEIVKRLPVFAEAKVFFREIFY